MMTDKQIKEKRKGFYKRFPSIYQGLDTGGYVTIDAEIWDWIGRLVEEVRFEGYLMRVNQEKGSRPMTKKDFNEALKDITN